MIKKLTKFFAVATLIKNLIGTKKGETEGLTQIHPSKISGRTVFIREKEYFIRESYSDNTTPIVFLHSWGSDSLGSWFKILPYLFKQLKISQTLRVKHCYVDNKLKSKI